MAAAAPFRPTAPGAAEEELPPPPAAGTLLRAERVDGLAEELTRAVKEAQAQFHKERDVIVLEFEASRVQLHTQYSSRLLDADRELQELLEEREALHAGPEGRMSDVVTINVGGQLFTVKRETLCVCQGSFMAELFSGCWDSMLQKDPQGHIFVDLDPPLFDVLLHWLRDKKIETPERPAVAPMVPKEDLLHFQAAVDYFGLRPFLKVPGLGPDGWGTTGCRPPVQQRAKAEPVQEPAIPAVAGGATASTAPGETEEARQGLLGAAGSFLAAHLPPLPSFAANASASAQHAAPAEAAPAGPSAPPGDARGIGTASAAAAAPAVRVVGWSQRYAHPAVRRGELENGSGVEAATIAVIADTLAQGVSAAVRSTRGFQSGIHYWEVEVLAVSDWSYIGLVSADWASVHAPVGHAPDSWGLASNGVAFAGQEEVLRLPVNYTEGSIVGVLLELGEPGNRTASFFLCGRRFDNVFTDLPDTVYPAVSNTHAPATYRLISDAQPPSVEGEPVAETALEVPADASDNDGAAAVGIATSDGEVFLD